MTADRYHHGNLREELLRNAVEVLSTQGIEALNLRALARALGVSHAAPTRHFANKADLLRAVAEDGVTRLSDMATDRVTAQDPLDRMLQMAEAYVDWARQNPAYYQVLRNPDVLRHGAESLAERILSFSQRQRAEIARAQAGGWRSDTDTDTLLIHLMSLTAGAAVVATDPIYRVPLQGALTPENITASLRLFLQENGDASRTD